MSNLPIIYPVTMAFSAGFLVCVLVWIACEKLAERRQRRQPWISPEVLREAKKNRRELP